MVLSGGLHCYSYRPQSVVTWAGPLPQEEAQALSIPWHELGIGSSLPCNAADGVFPREDITRLDPYFRQNTPSRLSTNNLI